MVDAVGYQAVDLDEEVDDAYDSFRENPANVINNPIETVRLTGQLGIVGLCIPDDPGTPDEMAAQGRFDIDFGKLFEKAEARYRLM